jgi:hypothetical protein
VPATSWGVKIGIVPCGCVALLNAADAIKGSIDELEGDAKTGAQIIVVASRQAEQNGRGRR